MLSISHALTSITSHAGTVRPTASANRVAKQFVGQYPKMLRIVLELHHVQVVVRAKHQMALRAAAHPANLLDRDYRHIPPGKTAAKYLWEKVR